MKYSEGDQIKKVRPGNGPLSYVGLVSTITNLSKHGCNLSKESGFFTFGYLDENYIKIGDKRHSVILITNDGTTTTAKLREGKNTLNTATATCNPSDTFDQYEGARIALARLFDVDPFSQDKPAYREVKRAAKVGEYIKVTSDSIGVTAREICKVIRDPGFEVGRVYVRTKRGTCYGAEGDGPVTLLDMYEYVVLEGYTPPQEPEKPVEVIANGERYVKA